MCGLADNRTTKYNKEMRKNRIRILSMVVFSLCLPFSLFAQIDKDMKEFDDFVKQQQKEFDDFVSEQNKEFAEFLKETWKEYDLQKPVVRPQRPEPVKPVSFDRKKPATKPQEVKVGEVTRLPIPTVTPSATFSPSKGKTPVPVIPGGKDVTVEPEKDSAVLPEIKPEVKPEETVPAKRSLSGVEFSFYSKDCVVNASLKNRLTLKGIAEKDISAGWETLSRSNYQPLIDDCLAFKKDNALNDYGYLLLTRKVATELCGSTHSDEIALMQMFLLSQSGYRVKVARMDNRLTLFYASGNMIYATCFITLNGVNYYRFDTTPNKTNSIYTYNRDFANAKNPVNMNITTPQPFSGTYVEKTLQAKAYPSVKVCSKVNSGLISFYKDYPQCDFSVYVGAPVSQEVQQTVLPSLQAAIQGKKQSEAANILINFVQTAFDYKTDGDQFGYEKPFFVDELFYYPYSDCEDRAVLYSYLVRTLMGLDVVLLEYPNHMATAVCFDENIDGDYITVSGKKYIICDPTYIGASIGLAMSQFKNVAAKKAKVLPYRIHDLPDPEKLENLSQFIARFGYKVRTSGTKTDISKSINHLLDDIHGKKEENLIETVSIRAMQKARYSTHNIGHYGLAFEYYTHFTSPIRRFPDMMVHRLVTKYMDGGRSVSEAKYEDLCDHSSNMEQIAANAERASIKYKQVEFMSERLGQIYDGVISGVTEWGLYVELNENKCEGLVPVRDLDDDYYEFDEKNYCLRGRRKNKIYSLGDAITVRVARANLEKKQLDFELIEK